MLKCLICNEKANSNDTTKIPLCNKHYKRLAVLSCYYDTKEDCPFDTTEEEWEALDKMYHYS